MRRPCMWFCLLVIAVCILWMHLHDGNIPSGNTDTGIVCLEGRVSRTEYRNQRTILYLSEVSGNGVSAENPTIKNCIGVICYLQNPVLLKPGQFVVLKGELETIEGERNPGEFSYHRYYLSRGYSHRLKKAEVMACGNKYDPIRDGIVKMEQYFNTVLHSYLSGTDYGVMQAMLLGDKSNIDETQKELFQAIGIYHILAISGLHITFLGNFLYGILTKLGLGKKSSMCIALTVLIGYSIMTGVSVSTVRAVIMFLICLGGKVFGRTYDMLTALAIAAMLTILHNPYECLDAGFLLSYLAVSGVAILHPAMPGVDFRKVRMLDSFWSSLAIWMLTFPVIINIYYEITLYSIPANILVIPTVSYLMLLGVAIILFHPVLPLLSQICANGCHVILHYYDVVVSFFAALPLGGVVTGKPEMWQIIVYLTGIVLISFGFRYLKRKLYLKQLRCEQKKEQKGAEFVKAAKDIKRKYGYMMIGEIVLLIVLVFILLFRPEGTSEITVLDVGQGDGICLNLQKDGVYMIDGGSTSRNGLGENVVFPFLKSEGISCVDGWFLTHPDTDHVSALLEYDTDTHIRIKRIYFPAILWKEFKEIRELADNNHIEVCVLFAGDVIQLKKWRVEVVSPVNGEIYENVNAASLVLYITDGTFRALLMGDAGIAAQEAVLAHGIEDITFLKVAHHGSARETNSEEFLLTVAARIAVISCAEDNLYGHPHAETLKGLEYAQSTVYRTDLQGAIRIRIEEGDISVRPYLIP